MFSAAAQEKGSIVGVLSDKETSGEPLPLATVQLKNTTKGGTTDFDGLYKIDNVDPGTYTLEFSFVGYETLEVPNVNVESDKSTNVSAVLGASAAALDEVFITVQTSREREQALLLEQKRAVSIKESIGAEMLTKQGVSDAATATTKISGVTVSETTGDIFIRGLGDRYLYTTFNGLPIPSDDVERKNIDLSLFSTLVIQSVDISKTYSVETSADQSSGNVDISSKQLSGTQEFSVNVRGGVNTNVAKSGMFDNFRVTPNQSDYSAGFLQKQGFVNGILPPQFTSQVNYTTYPRLTQQTWNPGTVETPLNYQYAVSAGKKFREKFKVFLSGSQSTNFSYRQGLFKQYRSNFIDDSLTDATNYSREVATTGLANLDYHIDDNNDLRLVSLFINRLKDEVFEGGRNGEGTFFEETAVSSPLSQFVRDQNTRQTMIWVNQLMGEHQLFDKNTLDWKFGFNLVNADEPNRIRNEINFDENLVQLGTTGGFQQRKSFQNIEDVEYAGVLKDVFTFKDDDNGSSILTVGLNYRNKQRTFKSQFLGVEEASTNVINHSSIKDLDAIFTVQNFADGLLDFNVLPTDRYEGKLDSRALYGTYNLDFGKFNINAGVRYQRDLINVTFDVNNFSERKGVSEKVYDNVYMIANLKYSIDGDQAIRFASSRTITLPEFKEISPFEYVSPTGQVTRGNPIWKLLQTTILT